VTRGAEQALARLDSSAVCLPRPDRIRLSPGGRWHRMSVGRMPGGPGTLAVHQAGGEVFPETVREGENRPGGQQKERRGLRRRKSEKTRDPGCTALGWIISSRRDDMGGATECRVEYRRCCRHPQGGHTHN